MIKNLDGFYKDEDPHIGKEISIHPDIKGEWVTFTKMTIQSRGISLQVRESLRQIKNNIMPTLQNNIAINGKVTKQGIFYPFFAINSSTDICLSAKDSTTILISTGLPYKVLSTKIYPCDLLKYKQDLMIRETCEFSFHQKFFYCFCFKFSFS
jgi:hypothetical protein